MTIESILVVDDEPLIVHFLVELFKRRGYQCTAVENGKKALATLKERSFDLVLTDMKLPDVSGLEVLQKAKESSPETCVIVMTAFGSIENAVKAIQLGAFNYLLKPFTADILEVTIAKANEHIALLKENSFLRNELLHTKEQTFVAASPSMQKILQEVKKIAKSDASILIHGESGTGKELIAATIHAHSLRSQKSYIKVNCAAIPDTLLESEFFGHEKGAFTGALVKHMGRFELAHKGTLFLDEVTEIPLLLQPKLLRAIQEQEFERVGGTKPIHVDVRFISSSNRDLKKALQEKIFREDLFYRLNVIPLHLPPLRERREDILPLAHYFMQRFSAKNRKAKKKIAPNGEKKLLSYPWPGNIRELSNVMERAVVLEDGPTVDAEHLYLD